MINKLVYLVDDDKNLRKSLQIALKNEGFDVKAFADAMSVLSQIRLVEPDIFVFDIRLGEVTGLELFQKIQSEGFDIPVIFISGEASLSEAVRGVQLGAYDFIEKPFAPEKLMITIHKCLELRKIKNQMAELRSRAETTEFKGNSKAFLDVLNAIQKVASTNSSILITGESGTGKELIAKEIHKQSQRADGPFIKVNCSSIPEALVESEFFGYNKGAFTGAERNKKGFFEQAHNGSIFLDEIGEMSLAAQAKILRATQNMEIQKLGSEAVVHINVRIIAATNRDLSADVKSGKFREDLFYRLNVFPIHSAPLRERAADIPQLAEYFLAEYLRTNRQSPKFISPEAMEKLMAHAWPGNIRELKNTIERMAILGGQTLDIHLLSFLATSSISQKDHGKKSLKDFRSQTEREYILGILKSTQGNISEAATILEIERTYLHKKIQDYQISKKEYFV